MVSKRPLPNQDLCGQKSVIAAFDGFIIYTKHWIYYYESINDYNIHLKAKYEVPYSVIENVIYVPAKKNIIVIVTKGYYIDCHILNNNLKFVKKASKKKNSPSTYLTHCVFSKYVCIFDEMFKMIILELPDFQIQYELKTSGFNIYLFFKLEPYDAKLFILKKNDEKGWYLETDMFSYDLKKLQGNTILSVDDNNLISSSIFGLDILNSESELTSIDTDFAVINCSVISENKFLLVTDLNDLYYLYLQSLTLVQISCDNLPIIVENVFIVKNLVFLWSQYSGFYIFDMNDSSKFGFIAKDNYIFKKETNIFAGISYAFKNDDKETVISYTDGYNSILSKQKSDIQVSSDKFNCISNQLFIGYISDNDFVTKNENSQYFINGVEPYLGNDFVEMIGITPTHALFHNTIKEVSYRDGKVSFVNSISKNITCFTVYNNKIIIYNKDENSIEFFPGIKCLCNSISFIPKHITVRRTESVLFGGSVDCYLSDDFHTMVVTDVNKACDSHILDNLDKPLSLVAFDTPNSYYVYRTPHIVLKVEQEEYSTIISADQELTHVFLLTPLEYIYSSDVLDSEIHRIIGICAPLKEIYHINYNDSKKNKLIKKYKGRLLQCTQISSDCIIIATTLEMFKIRFTKDTENYETFIQGVTKASLSILSDIHLFYTTRGLYMISSDELRITSSLLLSTIKEVNFDNVMNKILLVIDDCGADSLLFVTYDNDLQKFQIELPEETAFTKTYSIHIEPIIGIVFAIPGGVFNYRTGEAIHMHYFDGLPAKNIIYLKKWNFLVFTNSSYQFIVYDLNDNIGQVYKIEPISDVERIFVYDQDNLLLYRKSELCLFSIPKRKLRHLGYTINCSYWFNIHWMDASLLSLNGKSTRSGTLFFATRDSDNFLCSEYYLKGEPHEYPERLEQKKYQLRK